MERLLRKGEMGLELEKKLRVKENRVRLAI